MAENPMRQEAWRRHKANDFNGAERLYRQLIKEKPNEIDICNLGALLRGVGRGNEALFLYRSWIASFESSESLIQNAVNCALSENQIKEAREWLNKGLKKQSSNIEMMKINARLLHNEGRSEEAIRLLEETSAKKEDINIFLELG